MAKKVKGPKAGAPEDVLRLIESEASLSDIVTTAVKGRVMAREEVPVSAPVVSQIMQGFAGAVQGSGRAAVVGAVKAKAEAIIVSKGPSATGAVS